jgi:hypothetical protein
MTVREYQYLGSSQECLSRERGGIGVYTHVRMHTQFFFLSVSSHWYVYQQQLMHTIKLVKNQKSHTFWYIVCFDLEAKTLHESTSRHVFRK